MSPRPQIDHIRKPQILAAAAAVIGERGVAGTRIADIAERAGTSPAAILYWFGSKDELLAEALTFQEERFYEDITHHLGALDSPSERLRLLIHASLDGNDWALWLELWARAARDERIEAARRRLDDRWRREIAAVVRDGVEAGEFATDDADGAALTLAALIDGLAVPLTLGDPSLSRRRAREIAMAVAAQLVATRAVAA